MEFHDIKYHQFCWHGNEKEEWSFMVYEESFITMKLIWYSYIVSGLDNYAHKTSTETGLMFVWAQMVDMRATRKQERK